MCLLKIHFFLINLAFVKIYLNLALLNIHWLTMHKMTNWLVNSLCTYGALTPEVLIMYWSSFCPSKSNRGDAQTLLDSILKIMKSEFQSFKVSSGEQLGEELSVQVIRSSVTNNFDAFKICQTTRSPPSPEVIQSEIEVMQLDSSTVHRQTLPSIKQSIQLDHSFLPLNLGPVKSPLEEDMLIHFENICPKEASETEKNQVEYVEVDALAMQNGTDCVCMDKIETNITYRKRRPRKMASEMKKRTPEFIVTQEGFQEKVGGKLEDAENSFSASQSSMKCHCPEHETVREKKVKLSSPSNLKHKNDLVKGDVKVTTESSKKEAPHFEPSLKQTAFVSAADTIPNAAPLTIQDQRTVTIKATYTESIIIKFQLSISAGVADLEEKVIKRLKFKEGSFKCKYKDNNGDLVLIACDEDLQTCFGSLSPNDKYMRLSILPQTCLTI